MTQQGSTIHLEKAHYNTIGCQCLLPEGCWAHPYWGFVCQPDVICWLCRTNMIVYSKEVQRQNSMVVIKMSYNDGIIVANMISRLRLPLPALWLVVWSQCQIIAYSSPNKPWFSALRSAYVRLWRAIGTCFHSTNGHIAMLSESRYVKPSGFCDEYTSILYIANIRRFITRWYFIL